MGKKFSPREAELYKRCDEVLHYIWDPIGVSTAPSARDEYYGYLPQVFRLVRDTSDPDRLVDYLATAAAESMGLRPDLEHVRKVVDLLVDWREWIWEDIKE